MIRWVRDTVGVIWFFLKFATVIILGYLLMMGAIWVLQQPMIAGLREGSEAALDFLGRLETAVKAAGGLFLSTWLLRFFDQFIFRGGIKNRLGFVSRGSFSLIRMVGSHLVHKDHGHLTGNTVPLLIFAAAAILIVPALSLLLPLLLWMLFVQGIGVWIFGGKNTAHVGASGLALGLYSFDILHGVLALGWETAVAILLFIFFRRQMYDALRSRTAPDGSNVSVAGHLWGFISGIVAAYLISPFGPMAVY